MPRNPEEKEKCQEKLNQMQKFLPFLDFMIDKIKKKNEISLECQLNKFQVLRSMIGEKNEKYSLDVLIKVEHIIEKLISKLDYKENVEGSYPSLEVKDPRSTKFKMSASMSRTPSSPNSEDSKKQLGDSKARNFSLNTVDVIMKSLKMSVGVNPITAAATATTTTTSNNNNNHKSNNNNNNNNSQNKEKNEDQSFEEKSKYNAPGKILRTDLDKDLDGFDLSDCSNPPEGNFKSPNLISPGKMPSQEDLLSSSREKLLKSLQNRLFPNRVERASIPDQFSGNATNQVIVGEGPIKSFNQNSGCDIKCGSLENNERKVPDVNSAKTRIFEKPIPNPCKLVKTFGLLEKQRSDLESSDINLKQKLKEKLSTDICEVYRVPGKSVGGSLRCLKDSKEHKRSIFLEEEELFKPDILTKGNVPSRGSSSSLHSPKEARDKSRQDSKISELKIEKNSEKSTQDFSGSVKNKPDNRFFSKSEFNTVKNNKSLDKKPSNKFEKGNTNKPLENQEKSDKEFEMNKLNDDELTEFVKENIQHLPHLAKLKPADLRKTVEASFIDVVTFTDAETLSDDSLQEFDEFLSSTNRTPNELKLKFLSPNSKNESLEGHRSIKGLKEVGVDSSPKSIKEGGALDTNIGAGNKSLDADPLSSAGSLDEEEDYAIKLIEETTPKNISVKKKKGLLDLPIPETSDLFDDITSIESFESSNSPNESRDPRLKKFTAPTESEKSTNTQLDENSHQVTAFETKPQEGFVSSSVPIENSSGGIQRSEHKLGERPFTVSYFSEDSDRCTNKYSKELKTSFSQASTSSHFSNDPRLQTHNASEPKSYAEYKRMKRKEHDKLTHCETASVESTQRFCDGNISENSNSLIEKDTLRANFNRTSDGRPLRRENSKPKSSWSRSNSASQSCSDRKKVKPRKSVEAEILRLHEDFQEGKKRHEEDRQKIADDKRRVIESEELISPLEKLYQTENKPKTGRGYGIQRFKIPKKVNNSILKSGSGNQLQSKEINDLKNKFQTQILNSQNDTESSKANIKITEIPVSLETTVSQEEKKSTSAPVEQKKKTVGANQTLLKTTSKSLCNENKEDGNNKEVPSEVNLYIEDTVDSQTILDSETVTQVQSVSGSKMASRAEQLNIFERTPNIKNEVEKEPVAKLQTKCAVAEPVKKYETEVVECDSSMEKSTVSAGKSNAIVEKSTIMSKEEITQEFVEALIRKSFESGQGKLLLAQAKLFEELGKKLNSKKLKTIQKIINSESDSSSSSSELSSCNEKKKKKSKKGKKPKKRGKKSKRLVISSTSGTSSSYSSSESEDDVREKNSTKKKKADNPETQDKVSDEILMEEIETKKHDFVGKSKSKKKKKRLDYPGCFSRKRNKRKHHQKKLIEKILNEAPVNSAEVPAKEAEPKAKSKPKTKTKTELDKLHEDIKNMFISSGVVTATGQRMCRILRNSGGKMDNVDIVKESAKMVEEEKLKKVQQTCSRNVRPRNTFAQDSRSRSQSLDKSLDRLSENQTENECDQDPKLKCKPYVLLQKVDLNNFGYGVKISDDCISFCRIQGRNTALRGFKSFCTSFSIELPLDSTRGNLSKGIFLARNKRKCERLIGKICKTSYSGKKLMDVVKNLPLKMAKMKHLEFCEKKSDDTRKKKMVPEKLERKMARLGETKQFSDDDLMNHAFQLRKTRYRCKVCSQNLKNITEHYKTVHPEHGVLISRLCQKEATKAKSDAVKNNYEGEQQNALKECSKRNAKTLLKSPSSYQCRMCSSSRTNDVNVFFTHVTTHTGEVRFQCPNEECGVQTANGEEIKFHILTKHPKGRYDLYNKIIELYPSPIEGCQLFGFLCSKCNFVQLSRSNMEAHVSKQHPLDNVKIFKINMSSDTSNRSKIKRMVIKSGTKNSEQLLRCKLNKKKDEEPPELDTVNFGSVSTKSDSDIDKLQPEKPESEERENHGEYAVSSTSNDISQKLEKKIVEVERIDKVNETDKEVDGNSSAEKFVEDVNDAPNVPKNSADHSLGDSDSIIESLEVGPLKSLLLENSEVYYQCRVQNCGLFTKGFEKFERHLMYNHCKKKWEGFCKICSLKIANDLLSALKHLKFHVLRNKPIESTEELKPSKMDFTSEKVLIDSEKPTRLKDLSNGEKMKNVENVGTSYPAKPLLKVRTLVGDRLSTPKEPIDKSDIITITEEEVAAQASNSEKMFTIENVRSLKSEIDPDTNDIKREQVCIIKDQNPMVSQVGPGKVILVRSCPTRKIAIRPENNSVSFDVGQFNLVQTPVTTHPVVLSPVSTGTPIHLLSSLQPVGHNSRIAIKPVIVTGGPTPKNSSSIMPIIRPASASSAILPISTEPGASEIVEKSALSENSDESVLFKSKHPVEITVSVSTNEPKSSATVAHAKTLSEISNSEELEDKELINPLRIFTSQSIGSKTVKDVEIYKQMLTKTKLCHLFKCMAVECSFTCNSENIFTRHIGLHEAQRRLKKRKSFKESFPPRNKANKAFQWQQCAYCCQVLNYTDNALSRHILLEHGHCTYQCAYCFYRAVSQNYVEIHQNLVHSHILKHTSRLIYKCKPLSNLSPRTLVEKRGRKHSVRPYICDQCGKNFFVVQEFLIHLTTEHQGVTAYTCHICKNLCFKANRLINHYKLHSYCTYQCAYCLHGTETEVEMVFHLCNFHFSQPAVMYVRALPEGVESKGISQLESLRVVVYENDTLNEDCIAEADIEPEEDTTYDPLKESVDLSEIVAELGINSDAESECEVTPLLRELASLSDQKTKDVTVKTLLPNAQFSSENDNISEGCSVLISSGVSVTSTQNDDKELSIPLGQLPLEALNIKHVQHCLSTQDKEVSKKSQNLNEAEIKPQAESLAEEEERKKTSEPLSTPYVHNLPQVLLTRTLGPKNVYPSRRLTATKRTTEGSRQTETNFPEENTTVSHEILSSENGEKANSLKNKSGDVSSGRDIEFGHLKLESSEKESISVSNSRPLITSVVSLSKNGFENEDNETITRVREDSVNVSRIVINIRSDVNPSVPEKPSVNSVEDFRISDSSQSTDANPELVIDEAPIKKDISGKAFMGPKSPDIVILEEGQPNKNIETVTIDSDDEKDSENSKGKGDENLKKEIERIGNGEIRKEMEMLRHQLASETDSLLYDDSKANKSRTDLTITLTQEQSSYENCQPKSLLSPIEEAICSLNKKLKSETAKSQEKESKVEDKAEGSNSDEMESVKPRTRFGSRDKKKECLEEKNGEEEIKKEESSKSKKMRKELVGKELYICGNEQCTFAADSNSSLKDHLYVCDFSRVSSVLMCPHCSKHFKHFSPYLEHLKYHGEKKFHCGLCSFSSAVESATLRHLKQKHKCHVTKTVPKEPPKEEHVVFYPKNHKIDKTDFEENGYSPGDENKLPLQSVYQVNVKCAKCPYFTKVRSNMVRHLKIHMKSAETEGVIVPSTAPTNPVPCLETKEKMFDKMTNLAASSQLAQAEKEKFTSLPPQVEAKFPQFIPEHLRFKCCLPDCNYITVDDRMLKHHIKALHNEVSHYSCPHCRTTVHVDVRNVPLDKIGHHLKFHDSKLYKCGHCIYIHHQRNLVEKHACEKHADRRCFIQTVRDSGAVSEEEHSGSEGDASVWKCGRCEEFQSLSKSKLKDHLLIDHKTKATYQCQHCSMTGNSYKMFANHFASKHPGEKVAFTPLFYEQKVPSSKLNSLSGNSSGADSSNEHFDTTPLWQRGAPRIRHIRGILIEEEEVKTKKIKRSSAENAEADLTEEVTPRNKVFYCPLCSDKKKIFFTKNEDYFRTHLYQELNYQQFACILCGKMFVDRRDFDKHHARMHPDKPPEINQTKEDGEIIFWVDKVIAKQREQMKERKRKLSEPESSESSSSSKKKKAE